MENIKCSCKKHEENRAIFYCPECKIYMCNKCDKFHSELFQGHHQYKLDKDSKFIFTGFCKEINHLDKLEYFCKSHNVLCCASCIAKIKKNGKGQHTDCDVCVLNDIKEEKKNKLKENIKCLEDLSKTLEDSIKTLKMLSEKINEKKEEIKLKIQKVFTSLRSAINEREDFLLSKVDKHFDEIYVNDNIIKQSENLPNKIKASLEKGKSLDKEWNDDNILNSFINECINIENNIEEINIINKNIKKNNESQNFEIMFYPDKEKDINEFIEKIKKFGYISNLTIFYESVIISSNFNYKFILDEIEKRNNKIISSNLIYKATRDGDSIDNVFNKCNGIQNVIVFIKSDINCIFGGYTKVGFQKSNNSTFKDDSAFVFSLDTKKVYPVKKGQDAIRCCHCCNPQFHNEIYLRQNFLNTNENNVGKKNGNYLGFTKDYELNNGIENYKIFELEIYHFTFN